MEYDLISHFTLVIYVPVCEVLMRSFTNTYTFSVYLWHVIICQHNACYCFVAVGTVR